MDDSSGRAALRTYIIGLCMGSADAVPGVSGGTIALIAGVYERLIDAITALTPRNGLRLLYAFLPPDREAILRVLDDIDARFLLPLGFGVLTAVILLTRLVHYLDEHYPTALFGFFFGLIAASAIILLRQVSISTRRHAVAAVVGFAVAFALSGNVELLSGHALPLIFVAGAVAVSAMILPGISGSLILVVLGQYTFMSETLSEFTDRLAAVATGGGFDRLVDPGTTVVAFVVGAVIGLLSIARVVDWALDRDRATTLAFLVSLVVGALRAPVVEIGTEVGWSLETIVAFALFSILGAALLLALEYYAIDVEIAPEDDPAA